MREDTPLVPIAAANEEDLFNSTDEGNLQIIMAETLEFHGRKVMELKVDSELLPHYIEEILVNQHCPVLLPMGFTSKKESKVYFDITDAYPLEKVWQTWKTKAGNQGLTGDCLEVTMIEVFIKIIEMISLIENFLFINSGFCLDWDYIFFMKKGARDIMGNKDLFGKGSGLKLAFVPQENESFAISAKLSHKILKLIEDSLEIVEDEEWNYCGKQLLRLIHSEDSIQDVTRKLNQMAREISSRDWPDLSSLRQF